MDAARGTGGGTTSSGPAQSGGRAQFSLPLPEGTPKSVRTHPLTGVIAHSQRAAYAASRTALCGCTGC